MVSNLGELEGLVGNITGAGATSIQELRFLIPLAIVDECDNKEFRSLAESNPWDGNNFSPPPMSRKKRDRDMLCSSRETS